MLFFSREFHAHAGEHNLRSINHVTRCNVVSHATNVSMRLHQSTRVWGWAPPAVIKDKAPMLRHGVVKPGVDASHIRVSTWPPERNDGKMLMFHSGAVIRAGKSTHVDAVRCIFKFNQWARKKCRVRHMWHAAIGCPNMVLSGKLVHIPHHSFKDHWRCNHSAKFPGVALQTDERITPEVYPKSGAFIVPGVTTAAGAVAAIRIVADVASSGNQKNCDEVFEDTPGQAGKGSVLRE